MCQTWNTTKFENAEHVIQVFTELQGKRWLFRGQSKQYDTLVPVIDRDPRKSLTRQAKLILERQSIDLFRLTVRFFAHEGEKLALEDDIIALMVMRHYEVPTRLLDWSKSPWVAAFFAINDEPEENGEIWSFDEPLYETKGKLQWKEWPETTIDNSGDSDKFDPKLTMFTLNEPKNWFMCAFYKIEFPRQHAQAGAYTLTAQFNRDHAAAIENLLQDPSKYHKYVVPKEFKPRIREILFAKHVIWRGSLFPDTAGAAETARRIFPGEGIVP